MPPPLSYGLNLAKKHPLSGPTSQKRKKAVFDSDSDDDERKNGAANTNEILISTIGGLDEQPAEGTNAKPRPAKRQVVPLGHGAKPKPKIKPLSKMSIFADDDDGDDKDGVPEQLNKEGISYGLNSKGDNASKLEYTNLSALHSSKKHAAEAQEVDPSIYSYDAVYESLHAKPEKNKKKTAPDGAENGPQYMTSLLRSAEIRKRDQVRARDRMLAKEREAEGDEFADKEKFVTAAYKAQQEEMRRVEEEEKKREQEEEERRKKNGNSGMVGFYRDLLARGEEQHEAVMKAADEAARKIQEGGAGVPVADRTEEKTEAQMAAELNARGAKIAVNDDGHVVDKRQLLSAGLNVAPKPKTAAPVNAGAPGVGAASRARVEPQRTGGRAAQRARQTEMIAAQLEEQERQREEAEAAKQKEMAERSRSQKSTADVSSARERYLARKKEREAAAKPS